MKTLKFFCLSAISIILLILNSCERTNENLKGKVEFAVATDGGLKSLNESESDTSDIFYSWHLLISVVNETGEYVFEDEIIPVLFFGNEFITAKIEMEAGKYSLIKFMIVNPEGRVLYASPLEGSQKAHLVNDPLPIGFSIRPDQTSRIIPQVLAVQDNPPSDFGYAAFGFEIVSPLVAYVIAVDDNPLYARPSVAIPAKMTLFNPDGRTTEYRLEPRVNKILIKPGYDSYHVVVENLNLPTLKIRVETITFEQTTPDNPLVFNLSNQAQSVIEIQPGPEEGKDAMITDLNPSDNFGKHPYFEASFITEPVLTVMRTKRSLIHFSLNELPISSRIESVMLVLHFETPIWDSLYESELDDYMIWDDRLVFQQIVEPWDEHEVSWSNQPKSIEANQVFLPALDHLSTNMRVYDVSCLFIPCQEIAAPNYGIMFRQPESDFLMPGGLRFASSDYRIESMRPKLIVKYSLDYQ